MTCRSTKILNDIAEKVSELGGNAYYVGGCVRDRILGRPITDFDVEVHGLNTEQLKNVLSNITSFSEVGKSFGIFSLNGLNIDIALPRKERPTGKKHRDFDIDINPEIGTYTAALRRDFTMNAIMEDVLTGEITDHFNGIKDIENGIIRHVNSNTFSEDPLRVLRAAQFAARFEFEIHPDTVKISEQIDVSTLSKERVFEETKKALTKSLKPSLYFYWLERMNQKNIWFKGLDASSSFIDSAVQFREEAQFPLSFMLAAAMLGLPDISDVTNFLYNITNENAVIKYVKNMYMVLPVALEYIVSEPDEYTTNLLFDKTLFHKDMLLLAGLKNQDISFLQNRYEHYLKTVSRENVTGKDLLACGFSPTTEFSKLLKDAHNMYLSGLKKEEILTKLSTKYSNNL